MVKAVGWYQHAGVGFHGKNRQQGESFKYLISNNALQQQTRMCFNLRKTSRPCEKFDLVLSDSLSQSSDVTKGANGKLAKLSRSLRQKGK